MNFSLEDNNIPSQPAAGITTSQAVGSRDAESEDEVIYNWVPTMIDDERKLNNYPNWQPHTCKEEVRATK